MYIVYSGECSLYKNIMIKKDEMFNKYYKNIQVLKAAKGDIVCLEVIDSQPILTYAKGKDRTSKLEKITIKRIDNDYSLIVNIPKTG